jgi:hypothetical protein
VLFETRPSLWPFISGLLIAGFALAVLGVVLFVNSTSVSGYSGGGSYRQLSELFGVLLIAVAVVVIVARLIRWYFTSYAITNRRVIRKTGWSGRLIVDARFEKIQSVTMTDTTTSRARGYGSILYSLSVFSPSISPLSGIEHGGILWFAVPDPIEVRAFVEDVFETFSRLDKAGQLVALEERKPGNLEIYTVSPDSTPVRPR